MISFPYKLEKKLLGMRQKKHSSGQMRPTPEKQYDKKGDKLT